MDSSVPKRKSRIYAGKRMKVDPNKEIHSNFFLTINPHINKVGSSEYTEDTLRKKLREAALMFSDERFQKRIIYFATKDKSHTFESHIKRIDASEWVIEDGASNKVGLHLHLIYKCTHVSNIRLVFAEIRKLMSIHFGKSCHFHRHVIKSPGRGQKTNLASIKDYMNKNTAKVEAGMQP